MVKRALRLDEIGYWSEVKLDIVKKYARYFATPKPVAAKIVQDIFDTYRDRETA